MPKIVRILIKFIITMSVILSILFAMAMGYWLYQTDYVPYHGLKFDQKLWKEAEGENWIARCNMTADLLENHLHNGMSKEEVESLLGEIEVGYFYCLDRKIKCAGYYIGPCAQSPIGNDLYVCFDLNNVVTSFAKTVMPCKVDSRAFCSFTTNKCSCGQQGELRNQLKDCEIGKW